MLASSARTERRTRTRHRRSRPLEDRLPRHGTTRLWTLPDRLAGCGCSRTPRDRHARQRRLRRVIHRSRSRLRNDHALAVGRGCHRRRGLWWRCRWCCRSCCRWRCCRGWRGRCRRRRRRRCVMYRPRCGRRRRDESWRRALCRRRCRRFFRRRRCGCGGLGSDRRRGGFRRRCRSSRLRGCSRRGRFLRNGFQHIAGARDL